MKSILKKYVLLGLIALGTSTHYVPSILAMKPEEHIPFSAKNQKMLDKITQKFELGNPGDYKGYSDPNPLSSDAHIITKDKKIIFNDGSLHYLPKDEIEFILGHELGHVVYPHNIKSVANWNTAKSMLFIGSSMLAGGYIGGKIGKKYDNPEIGMCIGALAAECFTIYLDRNSNSLKKDIESHLQEIEYAADKISVEKLHCHDAAINFFKRPRNETTSTEKQLYQVHPSLEDRIARIQELKKKAQLAQLQRNNGQ